MDGRIGWMEDVRLVGVVYEGKPIPNTDHGDFGVHIWGLSSSCMTLGQRGNAKTTNPQIHPPSTIYARSLDLVLLFVVLRVFLTCDRERESGLARELD